MKEKSEYELAVYLVGQVDAEIFYFDRRRTAEKRARDVIRNGLLIETELPDGTIQDSYHPAHQIERVTVE